MYTHPVGRKTYAPLGRKPLEKYEAMFKNHVKMALRQMAHHKLFSALNIIGLAVAIAIASLIGWYVQTEFAVDTWMHDSEQTYRVIRLRNQGATAWTPPQLANRLSTNYPEVVQATGYAPNGEQLLTYRGKKSYITETAVVDSTFFQVLGMEFLAGDPLTALRAPNSMVITDRFAERLFDGNNPLGELLTYGDSTDYQITGILATAGKTTHLNADIFTRFLHYGNTWAGNNRATYIRIQPGVDTEALGAKIETDINALVEQDYLNRNYTPNPSDFYRWAVQPLSEVHLYSEGFTSITPVTGSIRRVYIFGGIALLILLVAIINYVNLTTARSSQRWREVGVKKITGATRGLLTRQFLAESLLQALLAGILALILLIVLLPLFNTITNRSLSIFSSSMIGVVLAIFLLAGLIGLLAGAYPAFILSGFAPVQALQIGTPSGRGRGLLRRVLVTTQFAVSIVLLIVLTFVYQQVNYMLDKDLGWQADQLITIPMEDQNSYIRVAQLREQFLQIPGVQKITTASRFPGQFMPDWKMLIGGKSEAMAPYVLFTDTDYAECLDLEILQGRFIDDQIEADYSSNFIVNETFVKTAQLDNPIGHSVKFDWQEEYGTIVGVVKDFHFEGVSERIEPLVMNARPWRDYVGVKLSTADLPNTIADLEELWTSIEPNYPMRYTFLNEEFQGQYEAYQHFGQSILFATLFTLFIALLGLFGLTAFTVQRRTKEIGVRKILGASVASLLALLAKEFVRLLGFACLLGFPLAYYLSNAWLNDFAHRTPLVWWVFLVAGVVVLLVGLATVLLQSTKAALAKPMNSLRVE